MILNVSISIDRLESCLKSINKKLSASSIQDLKKFEQYLQDLYENLTIIDHSRSLSILSLLSTSLEIIISSTKKHEVQEIFISILLLNSLEVYSRTFTSPDSFSKKVHKKIFSISHKLIPSLLQTENPSIFNQIYWVKSRSSAFPMDSSLLQLLIIFNLTKAQFFHYDEEDLKKLYLFFLLSVKNDEQFCLSILSEKSLVSSEKFVNLLSLLEILSENHSISLLVQESREKIKECFLMTSKLILINSEEIRGLALDPEELLKKLFCAMGRFLLRFTSSYAIYQYFYDVPVIMTHLLLAEFPDYESLALYQILKTQVLQILFYFYSEKFGKFPESVQIGIEDLLLTNFLFENNSFEQQELWDKTFAVVCDNLPSIDSLIKSISSSISQNKGNYSYLSGINQLVNSMLSTNKKLIDESTFFYLISEILNEIKSTFDVSIKQMLYQILSFVLEFVELGEDHLIKVFNCFYFEILPNDLENSSFFPGILSNLLKLAKRPAIEFILKHVSESKLVDFVYIFKLVVSKLVLGKNVNVVLENLIQAGLFDICILKLKDFEEDNQGAAKWVDFWEIIKIFRICRKSKYGFRAEFVVEKFRKYEFDVKQKIIRETSESLLEIVINQDDQTIRCPAFCQVVVEYLFSCDQSNEKYLELLNVVKCTNELFMFSQNQFLAIALYHVNNCPENRTIDEISGVIIKSIQTSICLKDFNDLIGVINRPGHCRRHFLLKVLRNSLSMKNKALSISRSLILPSKEVIEISLNHARLGLAQLKSFSFYFWIFVMTDSHLLDISIPNEVLSLDIKNLQLFIKFNNIIHSESEPIESNTWYLISFSSTLLKSDRRCSIFLSSTSKVLFRKDFTIKCCSSNEVKQVRFSHYDLLSPSMTSTNPNSSIKSSENSSRNRIKNFYLSSKVLTNKEVLELCKISWRYSLLGYPNHEDIDIKQVSELRESFILTWEEIIEKFSIKKVFFSNSHIFDVVRAYPPTRLLFELCHETQDLKELFEIFNICERIICFSNFFSIINNDFIRFLGHYFNIKLIDVRLNEVFLDIIKSAPDKYNKILFNSYLLNSKSTFLLQQSRRMEEVVSKFTKLKILNKINLMKFCRLIHGLPFESCVNYLQSYLNKNIEKHEEEIVAVIIHLIHTDNIFMIKCFLEVIIQDSIRINLDSKLFVVLLFIIEEKHDTELQISLIKVLCCKISERDEDKPEKIVNLVSQILPDLISKNLFEFLLLEGMNSNKYKVKIKIAMVNIALSRVRLIKDMSQLEFLIKVLKNHSDKIVEFIYLNDLFPSWIIFAVKCFGFTRELVEITKIVLVSVVNKENQDLGKLQEIFTEIPNTEIYLFMVSQLVDQTLMKFFQIFCILWVFPVDFIKQNLHEILKVLQELRKNEKFMKAVEDSLEIKYISNKLIDSDDGTSCLISGEIIKFYAYLIKINKYSPNVSEIIQDLDAYLSTPSVKYLTKFYQTSINELKSKESCEFYVSIFLYYSIVKSFYKTPNIWTEFLLKFTQNSNIFKKLSIIMNENLSKSLFYRITISKSTAIIPTGALSMSSIENTSINEFDDYCFGFDYDALKENSKICEILFEQNQTPIFNIIDKNNPTWKVLYNSLAIATKNYSKLDTRWRTGIYSTYTEVYETFDSSNISKTLMQLKKDPWFQDYLEKSEKESYKVQYDLAQFHKISKRNLQTLQAPRAHSITIRQRYDKQGRWVFLKRKSSKPPNEPSHLELPSMSKARTQFVFEDSEPFIMDLIMGYSFCEVYQADLSPVFSCAADYIKIQGTCFGKITISKFFFEFISNFDQKPSESSYIFSSPECVMILKQIRHIFKFSEISQLVLRKFIHQSTSFELVLGSGRSFLFNVFKEDVRKQVVALIENHSHIQVLGKNFDSDLKQVTQDWKKGKISNFEYLMWLNKVAGRSMHDLSQYPVFPWVVIESSSGLNEEVLFRNLAFPVRAQSEKAREDGLNKYLSWQDELVSPFIYGSHYSNSAIVVHYLLRLEPYTTQAKALHSGCFDVGDRLFYSIENAWNSTQMGGGDCKEMIPELFYQPWCLFSYSGQSFGRTQAGVEVRHLTCPAWAASNWDFVKKHRIFLESALASAGLPAWIDLVFGNKQKGEKALQACNVFCPETYDDYFVNQRFRLRPVDLIPMIEKIYHFGQTPCQVFKDKPHVKKDDTNSDNFYGKWSLTENEFSVSEREERKKGVFIAGYVLKNSVISLRATEGQILISKVPLKSLEEGAYLGYTEYSLKQVTICDYLDYEEDLRKILKFSCKTFSIFNEKILISGLHRSCSLYLHSLKGELLEVLYFHTEIITAVSCSDQMIFSGSLDGSLVSWSQSKSGHFTYKQSYSGHNSPILQIEVLSSYQIILSSSQSSKILLHDLRSNEILVNLNLSSDLIKVSELGFICVSFTNQLKFLHITGEHIYEETLQQPPNFISFTKSGDSCIVTLNDQVIIKDPTDQRYNKSLFAAKVFMAQPHTSNKSIVIWKNFYNESALCVGKADVKMLRKNFANNIT